MEFLRKIVEGTDSLINFFRLFTPFLVLLVPVGISLLLFFLKRNSNGLTNMVVDRHGSVDFVDAATYGPQAIVRKPFDYRWIVMPNRSTEIRKIIQKTDKNFYPIPMMDMAKELFKNLQQCWMEGNTGAVAGDLHPNYYAKLKDMVDQGFNPLINLHIEDITFHNFYLTFYKKDKENEYVTIYLESQMIRYAEEAATGEIVSGSITEREESVNLMKFVRPAGSLSETDKWLLYDFTLSVIGVNDEKIEIKEG